MAEADPYNTGDAFTDSVLEESRRRRQTGIGGSTSPDIDYLNSPPYRDGGIGTRESTNVDDRRGQDWDKTQPMATKVPKAGDFIENSRPSTPINTWTTAIRGARGFMETVNDTLGYLLNPQPTPEIDPGSEDAYARQLLAQRGQGRLAAGVATDLLGTGGIAALARPGASAGAFGGRLPTRAKISDDIEARKVWEGGAGTEFRLSTKDGKKAGEFTINDGPVPGTAQIENIDVRVQGKGTGTQVYDAAEEMATANGKTLVPSATLQEGTYRIWNKRNPELLEAGRYKKGADGAYERGDDTFGKYFSQAAE